MSEPMKDKLNYCQQCDKQFQCTSSYKIHMDKHAGKRYNCNQCGKSYTASYSLTIHKRTHSNTKPYKCQYCLTAFIQSGHCLRHEKSCQAKSGTPKKRDNCKIAREESNTMKSTKSKSNKAMIVCSICKSMFTCMSSYRVHEKKHQGHRHYCTRCAKSFTTYSQLRSHEKNHDHVTKYPCDQCDKTFNRKSNLSRHKHLHKGKHRHVCHVCGKSFILLEGYTAHLKVHETTPSAWCNICGASFKFMSSLKTHQKMHSNKKDFKCEICGREFLRKRTLEDHMKVHKKGFKHKAFFVAPTEFCTMCSKSFSNRYGLQRHLRKHKLGLLKNYNRIQLKNSQDPSNHLEIPAPDLSKSRTGQVIIHKEIPHYHKIDPVHFQDESIENAKQLLDNEEEIDNERTHVTEVYIEEDSNRNQLTDYDIDEDNEVNHFDDKTTEVCDENIINNDTAVHISHIESKNNDNRCQEEYKNSGITEFENSENRSFIACEKSVNNNNLTSEIHVGSSNFECLNTSFFELKNNVNRTHNECANTENRSIIQMQEICSDDTLLAGENMDINSLNENITGEVEINITAPGYSIEHGPNDGYKTGLQDESQMVFVVHNQVMVPLETQRSEPFDVIQKGEFHMINENASSSGPCQDLISTAAKECNILPHFNESFVNVHVVTDENKSIERIVISENDTNFINVQSSEIRELNFCEIQQQVTSEAPLIDENNKSLNKAKSDKLNSRGHNEITKQCQKVNDAHNSKKVPITNDKYDMETKEDNFECRFCLTKYANNKSLNSHLKTYHKDGESKIYKCNICNMMYASKLIYFNHIDNHRLKGKKFDKRKACNLCGSMFTSFLSYNRHRRMKHHIFDDSSVEIESESEKGDHSSDVKQKTKKENNASEASGNYKESENFDLLNDNDNTNATDQPCESNNVDTPDNVYTNENLSTVTNKSKCRVSKTQMKFRQRFQCPKCPKSFHMKYSRRQHMHTHSKSGSSNSTSHKNRNDRHSVYSLASQCHDSSQTFSGRANIDTTSEKGNNDSKILDGVSVKVSALDDEQVKAKNVNNENKLNEVIANVPKLNKTSNSDLANIEGNVCLDNEQVDKKSTKGNAIGDITYSCHKCEKEFDTKHEKIRHVKDEHGSDEYLCENCPKKFSTMTNLRRHISIHHDKEDGNLAKNFMCTQCGKCYTAKDSLRIHMYTHTGERPYKCNQCDASYSQPGHLQRHIRCAHIKKKMYKCNYAGCSKSFCDQSKLTMHSKTHIDVKRFQCNICQKLFKTSDVLKRHIKTHQDNDKFECNICSQQLASKVCLMRHLKRHELAEKMNPNSASYDPNVNINVKMRAVKRMEEKKYQCAHCSNKFTTVRGMNAHIQKFCKGHSNLNSHRQIF